MKIALGPPADLTRPTTEGGDLSERADKDQPVTDDRDDQDGDAAVRSTAEQAEKRQQEYEESGQENPA
jgi:hypothetical protein